MRITKAENISGMNNIGENMIAKYIYKYFNMSGITS